MAHLVVQEVLGWKPSQGKDSLPRRGDMHKNDRGQDEQIDARDWDDRVDSVTIKPWIEKVTGMMVERIEVIEKRGYLYSFRRRLMPKPRPRN